MTRSIKASVSPTKRALAREAGEAAGDAVAGDGNESLMKRMAGPSSAKAGLGRDQEDINRKIYEASKGSKFFNNEVLQDERITRNIDELLDKRDAALAALHTGSEAERKAKWASVEAKIQAQALELEAKRNVTRAIIHADMDMFYAAAELLRHPDLEGTAFAVGSGVLLTASYEARQFGCRSGMAEHIAKALCPHLQIVKGDMKFYVDMSRNIMDALRPYDENLMQMSLDEAYLDITAYCQANEVGIEEVVAQMREDVKIATGGLTVSCGIAPNTMLAKISSDKNKPNGQYRVQPERQEIIEFMSGLSVRKVPGIGRVTERILEALEVKTCGDIWTQRVQLYLTLTPLQFEALLSAHLGLGGTKVEPASRGERKSVGREHTFKPTSNLEELLFHLRKSADQVAEDLKELDYQGQKVSLKCKGADYKPFTRDRTYPGFKYKADDLFEITKHLLVEELARRRAAGKPDYEARLIGVRVSTLRDLRAPNVLKAAFERAVEKQKEGETKKKALSAYADTFAELGEDEDEEARQFRLAVEASLAEMEGNGTGEEEDEDVVWVATSPSASAPAAPAAASASTSSAAIPPIDCPLGCGARLTFARGISEAAVNAQVGAHMDQCMGAGGAQERPAKKQRKEEQSPKGKAGKKEKNNKKRSGAMDQWLRKGDAKGSSS